MNMRKINTLVLFFIVLGYCYISCASKDNLQIERYESGDIKSIGNINNGKKVGVWAFYDELGTRVDSIQYANGVRNGWFKGYDLRVGQLDKNGQYIDDKETGVWESYHEGNALHSRETFKSGNRVGESIYYYVEGTPKMITQYDDSGKQHGKTEEFYVSGELQIIGQYHSGKLDGEWKEYYENGLLKETYSYQDGLWHGTYEKYYPNGNIAEKGKYESDNPSGIWEYFDINGMVVSKKRF
ncbi:toxin-antitoxin system YwqK family antitoxin [uncultured Aquimarina sp.]|uniref:toxin-antitoxin system YwqK family antitoxin n=1 Tax=uncultured Aquimarina sp. TaxID=575652 RepID=UPI0026370E4D|nr:toxin-antitoxin system YwqK family antitoxin [uncultured Aquimarina sp.]